jgi:hypothetical protein
LKYQITYARDIVDFVDARDTDHAARLACAAVFACDPAMNARVMSVVRIDPPADTTPCPDCQERDRKKVPMLKLPAPTTPDVA